MKLTKVLLGSAFAVSAVTIPVTTLSSCGTSWGVLTPFSIGGTDVDENTPFYYLLDPYYSKHYYDADGKEMTYLQSNYSVDVKNGVNYAYATPMKWNDDAKDWSKTGSSGWYTSGDEAFASTQSYEEGGETKTVTCARNATLSGNTDFVTTIGSTIKTYLEAALNYQASQINTKDLESSEKNLGIAWGSEKGFVLNHGKKGGDADEQKSNNDFYEYLFANANINAGGKSKATFRVSSVNFHFLKKMFLPNYNQEPTKGLSGEFITLLEGESGSLDAPKYYSAKTDEEDHTILTYKSVPIEIWVESIGQTYLDTTNKKGSFLVSDYYSSSDNITDSVGNSWKKNMPKFTDRNEQESIPHYKSFNLSTGVTAVPSECIPVKDQRMSDYQITKEDFIALIDYTVDYHKNDPSKTTAQISKLSNLFPAYLLDIYGDEMYKHARNDDNESPLIIDSDTIDEKTSMLLQLLNRTSKEGMKAKAEDLNDESKRLLSFLGYMFSDSDKEILTSSIFKLVDL